MVYVRGVGDARFAVADAAIAMLRAWTRRCEWQLCAANSAGLSAVLTALSTVISCAQRIPQTQLDAALACVLSFVKHSPRNDSVASALNSDCLLVNTATNALAVCERWEARDSWAQLCGSIARLPNTAVLRAQCNLEASLCPLLRDAKAEVRAATLDALGALVDDVCASGVEDCVTLLYDSEVCEERRLEIPLC
jgi:hypothetical protein